MSIELDILAATSVISSRFGGCFDFPSSELGLWTCEKEKSFRCHVKGCAREFSSKRNLVDHCRGHHQGAKPHTCTFLGCGKSFLRPAHLLIHTRIHTGEKPFVCEYEGCGKRWNQKSALKQHLRSHTGEKPFQCTTEGCGKKFSTSSSCKRHILTHGREEELFEVIVPISHKRSLPTEAFEKLANFKRFALESHFDGKEEPKSFPMQQPEVKMHVNFILN